MERSPFPFEGSFESECPYGAGDPVPDTGIYEICHDQQGYKGTAVFLRYDSFPPCACCGGRVRYRLLHAAPHLLEDPDFQP
jgi:hypothetical protein